MKTHRLERLEPYRCGPSCVCLMVDESVLAVGSRVAGGGSCTTSTRMRLPASRRLRSGRERRHRSSSEVGSSCPTRWSGRSATPTKRPSLATLVALAPFLSQRCSRRAPRLIGLPWLCTMGLTGLRAERGVCCAGRSRSGSTWRMSSTSCPDSRWPDPMAWTRVAARGWLGCVCVVFNACARQSR